MKTLAIEAANKTLSVAVLEDQQVLSEETIQNTLQHSVTLVPAVERVLVQAHLEAKDLDRVAVSNGPGSYTGLRIGVSFAKTLAHTLNLELVPVSSLAVLAQRSPKERRVAFFDARRSNVYAGYYGPGDQQLLADQHLPMTDLLKALQSLPLDQQPQVFLSPDLATFKDAIQEAFPDASCRETYPLAQDLAQLADRYPAVPIHLLTPYYLKLAEAEENWLLAHQLKASHDFGEWVDRSNVTD